jgi:hypothetical protein
LVKRTLSLCQIVADLCISFVCLCCHEAASKDNVLFKTWENGYNTHKTLEPRSGLPSTSANPATVAKFCVLVARDSNDRKFVGGPLAQ